MCTSCKCAELPANNAQHSESSHPSSETLTSILLFNWLETSCLRGTMVDSCGSVDNPTLVSKSPLQTTYLISLLPPLCLCRIELLDVPVCSINIHLNEFDHFSVQVIGCETAGKRDHTFHLCFKSRYLTKKACDNELSSGQSMFSPITSCDIKIIMTLLIRGQMCQAIRWKPPVQ